jgi:hypothetical protein
MEPRLSSIKWCRIKAGGGKENTKRNAYHEGDIYGFCKNSFIDEKTEGMGQDKEAMMGTVQAMDSHMTCEVCGNVGHSGNDCPETHEEVAFINNGFCQPGNNGWNNRSCPRGNSNYNSNYNSNQPSLNNLVLDQVKISENITKKLMYNDKMLETNNSLIESLSSAVKNQLSFNKMIETQIS